MTKTALRKLRAVDRLLEKEYGARLYKRADPLDELIGTVLSQNTNDTNSGRAYRAMREAFPTWEDVMNAPRRSLEKALRPGGLARTKSARIQRMLRTIATRGALGLAYLRRMPTGEAERALLALDGVGHKTARCVLLFALGRDVFPIDTHILRILKRLDVIPARMTAERAHSYVPPLIPKGRCLSLHLNLITHGRRVCRPRTPGCGSCVIRRHCPYPGLAGTMR